MTYYVQGGSSLSQYEWIELSEDDFPLVPTVTDKGALTFHKYGNPIPLHGWGVGQWLKFTTICPEDLSEDF